MLRSAAALVDGGRAGTLSRLEEVLEFAQSQGYKKLGLAYCWGLEDLAISLLKIIKTRGLSATAVSCTVGAEPQSALNSASKRSGVACNPIGQAHQLHAEGVDFAVQVGLCLGHDVLFTREFQGDQTTLIVKDRKFAHNPLLGVESLSKFDLLSRTV
ncbi:MAG: DUF1847 domain-containing protein [Spirochaetales bacterium]|nr:DUF1847 domain-containing protein [Spirochaetales bacterium]